MERAEIRRSQTHKSARPKMSELVFEARSRGSRNLESERSGSFARERSSKGLTESRVVEWRSCVVVYDKPGGSLEVS